MNWPLFGSACFASELSSQLPGADFSFRSDKLVGYLPIAPDTIVRDHRKIVFYDVTELDPGKGEAFYGGGGVGGQDATPTTDPIAKRRVRHGAR